LKAKSRFFAYLERLRWIRRWGLKRNVVEENVMEHSWQVATIAHVLALIERDRFGVDIQPEAVVTAALYHDVSEIITGDLPSPVKYHSERIRTAYQAIEHEAEQELLALLPDEMQKAFAPLLIHQRIPEPIRRLVKAADLISAFLKCQLEVNAGNAEFQDAKTSIERQIRAMESPAVDYFMYTFIDSYLLTLDELLAHHQSSR
jgi:5'-deoxynucleotidase